MYNVDRGYYPSGLSWGNFWALDAHITIKMVAWQIAYEHTHPSTCQISDQFEKHTDWTNILPYNMYFTPWRGKCLILLNI